MKKFRLINNRENKFPSNVICNMKYRWYSIIFWVLYNQFEFFFNTYFFMISITQCIEKFAISSPLTSLGPWLLVYFISLFKESYDDYKRNERDYNINNQLYTVYRNKTFKRIKSKNIKVGDFIILEKDQRVPADVVLLKASDTTGQLFIRTDQLDGETDWKLRSAVPLTQNTSFNVIKDIFILAEEPNKEIYNFNGIISLDEIDTQDVTLEQPTNSKYFDFYKYFPHKKEEEELADSEIYDFLLKTSEVSLSVDTENTVVHRDLVLPTDQDVNDKYNDKFNYNDEHYDKLNVDYNRNYNVDYNRNYNNEHYDNDEFNYKNSEIDPLSNKKSFIENNNKEGLSLENMLWMNTVVATCSALCCVVYTGNDTRSMINTSKPRNKIGTFDLELNTYSKFLGISSAFFAAVFTYMRGFTSNGPVAFIRFLVLFSSIIPISLKVTIDMARYVYSYYIVNDNKIPNTIVRNSSIPEELGRISYFLTDKTGTLTKNEMEMKKVHLGTSAFTQDLNEEIFKSLAKYCSKKDEQNSIFNRNKKDINNKLFELVEALCLCHNVTPVIDNKNVTYQASSPDEVAIVKWTELVGMKLYKRDKNTITILDSLNDEQVYEILEIFPFTSETKRMGILVKKRAPSSEILFFMKGADIVMTKIIQPTDWVEEETENMARDGLRTLVIAKKIISEEQYIHFQNEYNKAKSSI